MGGMRLKLLENEAEGFREQIVAVFRSLERAFQVRVCVCVCVCVRVCVCGGGEGGLGGEGRG